MSQFINDEYHFNYGVLQCHAEDCKKIWLEEEMGSYKRCPYCGAKYHAKRLKLGVIAK